MSSSAPAVRLIDPVGIMKNTISIAFFPIFVKVFSRKAVDKNVVFKYSVALGIITFIGAAVVAIVSQPLIPLLLSEDYAQSASIFAVLIFYSGFSFANFPFQSSLQAANYEKLVLKIAWIPSAANVFLNLVFLYFFGLIGIAYSTLVVAAINYLVHMMVVKRLIKKGKI